MASNKEYVCGSCSEWFKGYDCDVCKKSIRSHCEECHKELVHDIITPQFMRPQFGGGSASRKPVDPEGDWGNENAIRILEDG